ncbi:hypothetical protein ZWY2020_037069 [Hordeum vulgare]|nr:hypothetical protein ZWY2020_037069 [Hordeum vulgare]
MPPPRSRDGLLHATLVQQVVYYFLDDICIGQWNDSCHSSINARLCIIQYISTWMCSFFMDVLPILIETSKQRIGVSHQQDNFVASNHEYKSYYFVDNTIISSKLELASPPPARALLVQRMI